MIPDPDRAGVEQAEALERRCDREGLGEQQSLPEPVRTLRLGQKYLGAIDADEMDPDLGRLDPVADPGALIDGEHELTVGEAAVDDPPSRPGFPALTDRGLGDNPEHHRPRRARARRVG